MVPDLVRGDILFFPEIRAEEILIFLMGALAFLIFIKNERQIIFQKKEKEKDEKKIEQAVKDLVESYSYIGEVNRKMDILMGIALGLSDQKALSKKDEKETYMSIVNAAGLLLKADLVSLRFVNIKTWQSSKEFRSEGKGKLVKNTELAKMKESVGVQKIKECLIISSSKEIKEVKSFLVICGYDPEEESSPKNIEILKVFASQALFLYSFTHDQESLHRK